MDNDTTNIPAGTDQIRVGIGWNHSRSDGHDHDLDSSIILLDQSQTVKEAQDICFYQEGHKTVHGGAVIHYGDETTGQKEGDDETIDINLDHIPSRINKLVVVVSIHLAQSRNLNFGKVDGAYVRISNRSGDEIAAFDLSEEASLYTAIEFCEIVRTASGWQCRKLQQGTTGGLASVIAKYGMTAKPPKGAGY